MSKVQVALRYLSLSKEALIHGSFTFVLLKEDSLGSNQEKFFSWDRMVTIVPRSIIVHYGVLFVNIIILFENNLTGSTLKIENTTK